MGKEFDVGCFRGVLGSGLAFGLRRDELGLIGFVFSRGVGAVCPCKSLGQRGLR